MKGRGERRSLGAELQDDFVRGFISTGLLAALTEPSTGRNKRRILRLALLGGTALAAGSVAARALRRRELASTLTAIAAGAAGLLTIEHFLSVTTSREKDHGQEET